MTTSGLTIAGQVSAATTLTYDDLNQLPAAALITDVSTLEPGRQGRAATLRALLDLVGPAESATHLTLHSDDGFSASLPLADVRDRGLVIFDIHGAPVDRSFGGPFRFLIPNAAECRTADVDACANVKHLVQIDVTEGPGTDTR